MSGQKRHHFFQDRWINPGAGVVIEINNFARDRHGR
jgi:hypothetical protein